MLHGVPPFKKQAYPCLTVSEWPVHWRIYKTLPLLRSLPNAKVWMGRMCRIHDRDDNSHIFVR